MKLNYLFVILVIITGFFSCKPDQPEYGSIELTFKARYISSPLVIGTSQTTGVSDPVSINFTRFEFFISNIKASLNNQNQDLSDVAYINLSNTSTTALAEAGDSYIIENIPVGTYQNLKFTAGLSDAVNSTSPGDYTSSSPLGDIGNYWASWNSYILSKFEGSYTLSNSSNTGFLYHSGVNGMSQEVNFTNTFDIKSQQTTSIIIEISAEDIFFKTGNEIDIITHKQTHSGQAGSVEYNLAKQSLENLATAMSIAP